MSGQVGRDARALLRGMVLLLPAGLTAVTVGLLPHSTLPLVWPVRLLIGAVGAVLCGLGIAAACRWVLFGGGEDGES
jgi:hypothetical protein